MNDGGTGETVTVVGLLGLELELGVEPVPVPVLEVEVDLVELVLELVLVEVEIGMKAWPDLICRGAEAGVKEAKSSS